MQATQDPVATPAPQAPAATTPSPQPAVPQFASPDRYDLSGNGIDITFLPVFLGGLPHLTYQDPQRTLQFRGDEIRRVDVPDLGSVVSVTLVLTPDSGSTTFSFLLPRINLPKQIGSSTPIHTDGITTHHRFSLVPQLNLGQLDRYHVTPLRGTASLVIIPL